VIKSASFSALLFDYLLPYFEHKQYLLRKGDGQFTRLTSFGHSGVVCTVSETPDGSFLNFQLGLRHSAIEQAMAGLFGNTDYYHGSSYTLLVDWRYLQVPSGAALAPRILLRKREDIAVACDAFIAFMDRQGWAFLDNYRSLKAIDKLYNRQGNYSALLCAHQYQRCFRGMLAAQMLHRPGLAALRNAHRTYLLQRGYSGMVVRKLDLTFAQMGNLSLN
jgi:hypothetical protein